jgi:hypothetical protein
MYTCDKCSGTSTTSHLCENPSCPLMPCCLETEENCKCFHETVASYDPLKLKKFFDTAIINTKGSFFIGNQGFLTPYNMYLVKKRGISLLNIESSN